MKKFPKIYWIYLAVLFVAEVIVFSLRPDKPGLYTQVLQVLPLAVKGNPKKFQAHAFHFRNRFFCIPCA